MKSPINLRHTPLFLALSLIGGVSMAQTTQQTTEGLVEEVVVTGKFAQSLQSAMEVKRNSATVVEAISSEDIGQLPDVSISDSLKRLPGLAQDRDRGNGSQISIRGMGGMLGFTTLNGREVAILEETRNIRYDQFPSELINSAQVYKTPQASIAEGGVSGSVNLNTIKPLDYDSTKVVVDVRATSFDLGKDIDDAANSGIGQRYSISYIDQFADDTLGVALGYSTRSEPIATQRAELWNYGDTWHNLVWDSELNAPVAAPWGGSALVRGGEDERQGFMGALQWRPNDNLEIAYDGFWSSFDVSEQQRGFDFGIKEWGNGLVSDKLAPTAYDNLQDGAEYDLLGGTVELSSLRNLNEEYVQNDELTSHGLNVKWTQDLWTIIADAGVSETSRDKRWSSVRTNITNPGWAKFGSTSDDRMTFELLDADLTDLSQNSIGQIQVQPDAEGGDKLTSFRLDVQRDLEVGILKAVKFGLASSSRDKFEHSQIWTQDATQNIGGAIPASAVIDAQSSSYWSDLPEYLSLDRNAIINHYFGSLKNPNPRDADDLIASWNVSEDIFAQYIQVDLATEVAGMSLTGNIGVRNVDTETTSSGYQQGITEEVWEEIPAGSGTWVMTGSREVVNAVAVDHDYTDVLPSTNWTLAVTDEHLIRFAAGKTMARAPVNMMSPSINLNQDLWGSNPGESTSGNPKLNPFRADQADLAYEWYYSEGSQIAVNLFYKDLESFIARAANAETVTYNGNDYLVSRPINGSGGYIRGYELLWQQSFDFLPAPFNGLGVYTNYSHNESNVEQFVPLHSDYKAQLTGLSEDVANFTLWYYINGFEARTSYSYRSAFQRDINLVMGEEGMNDSEGYWDLSLSYEFNDHYKVSFQVQNLTNEPYKTYGLESNNPAHINKYEEFGTRYSIGLNWKL
ncbi:TonB-dependent receptor [Cellvibrio mixtus]|uniref:TonB-dependent receptor n=1 Tax=Cellvibrio mixtus TaxID=39650 RepID=UPI000587DD0C|nr:TonB-dependent receptor [Cellvibrio mixtus]